MYHGCPQERKVEAKSVDNVAHDSNMDSSMVIVVSSGKG